ncbi:E3 ubiquitin-protein ligase TRIM63-like isoform X4 [Pseudoliparis swirei]|uniref:E3 ubiquitin-protein ligase TRIM63-like isoform X4 n=1 Tax=Pseudoliparis swirei TaxID=2059687 RepID=UPI0024BE8799|nr:E3 ubiquitin-protein ligase TRIM63-like isoform X4 [Pseudoliparis swirei]
MESLEKQLICPICLDTFTKPVVILPCQHNLCRKCADEVFQASNPYLATRTGSMLASGGRFRCPTCRQEVVLDRHGVQGLQRNLLVENIIDMYRGSSRPLAPEGPRCASHQQEKLNIFCVSCGVPTCSLCKVFGAHQACEVAPLDQVFLQQQAQLSACISLLVGNNQRTQAVISELEETCSAVTESGRQQQLQVGVACDHLLAALEQRRAALTLRLEAAQQQQLDRVRGERSRCSAHLETSGRLLEAAAHSLERANMAEFLQTAKPLLQKVLRGGAASHLEDVRLGDEDADRFTADFERQRRALATVDFLQDEDEDEDEAAEARGTTAANQEPPLSTGQPTGVQLLAPPPRRLSETPPIMTSPTPNNASSTTQAPPPLPIPTASPAPHSDQQNESEDSGGPKHVFSFSWLNQK